MQMHLLSHFDYSKSFLLRQACREVAVMPAEGMMTFGHLRGLAQAPGARPAQSAAAAPAPQPAPRPAPQPARYFQTAGQQSVPRFPRGGALPAGTSGGSGPARCPCPWPP